MNLIKIFQWNTLADTLSDAFPLVKKEYLNWNYRSQLIQKYITQHPSDIYCFEEVDHPDFFQNILKDYHIIFQKKSNNQDGILIVYKNTLKLESVQIIPFIENNKISNQFFIKVSFFDFIIIATHLKAKAQFEEIRKQQLIQLSKYLDHKKIIICGDFNTQPELSAVSNFYTLTGMQSTNNNTPTTSKNRGHLETSIKDYILYKGITLKHGQVGPDEGVQITENGLPSEHFPSDHIFLVAEFEL